MWPNDELVIKAQALPPDLLAGPFGLWWLDSGLLTLFVLLLLALPLVFFTNRRGTRYLRRQERFLDQQERSNERALAQNEDIQRSIDEQYARVNQFNEAALTKSDEALRLHAQILAELRGINEAMTRLAARGS